MACVSLQIRAISVFSGTVQVVVFLDQAHELVLNVRKLLRRKLILVRANLLLSEEAEETELVFEKE